MVSIAAIQGIGIPFNPAGKGGVAQVPAGRPAQATTGGQRPNHDERDVGLYEKDWMMFINHVDDVY